MSLDIYERNQIVGRLDAILAKLDVAHQVSVLKVEPGDIIVLRTPESVKLSAAEVDRLQEHLSDVLPKGVLCAVLDGGLTLEVVRTVTGCDYHQTTGDCSSLEHPEEGTYL